ncbi:MAG: hypothetical protein HOQ05_09430 [Corynebacteriales bacterium]|nr:hypothetical protein [Mycobacteriales bacterium]
MQYRFRLRSPGTAGRYRAKRLFITALVILLLVPAGVLAIRSLFLSMATAEEVHREQRETAQEIKKANLGPYGETPAVTYAQGAEGIVVPAPAQVGEWTPEQVADVQERTKNLLITARLDDRVLAGDTAPYLEQLSESARTFSGEKLETEQALGYITRLAPGYTLAEAPRVKGAMTVTVGDLNQLVVSADFVWAYALNGPTDEEASKGPGGRVVVVHSQEQYEWYPDKGFLPEDRGLRPGDGSQYVFNMDCELAKEGMIALPKTVTNKGKESSTDKVYDPQTPLEQLPHNC